MNFVNELLLSAGCEELNESEDEMQQSDILDKAMTLAKKIGMNVDDEIFEVSQEGITLDEGIMDVLKNKNVYNFVLKVLLAAGAYAFINNPAKAMSFEKEGINDLGNYQIIYKLNGNEIIQMINAARKYADNFGYESSTPNIGNTNWSEGKISVVMTPDGEAYGRVIGKSSDGKVIQGTFTPSDKFMAIYDKHIQNHKGKKFGENSPMSKTLKDIKKDSLNEPSNQISNTMKHLRLRRHG